MREMGWQVDEEVNWDHAGEADEMNLEPDFKDKVWCISERVICDFQGDGWWSRKGEKRHRYWLEISSCSYGVLHKQPTFTFCKGKRKGAYSSSWNSLQNYGTPPVNGITQCYLPPDRGDRPAFTPTGQVGIRYIDPVRMKGWVGLVGWLHTEMVYPSTDEY